MKTVFKKWKWAQYIEAILLVVLGSLIVAFNSNEGLYAAVGYMVGVYLLLNAILLIVASVALSSSLLTGDLICGILLLIISIEFFVYPGLFVEILPLAIGVGLIGGGIVLIARSIKGFILLGFSGDKLLALILGILESSLGSTFLSIYYSGNGLIVVPVLFVIGGILLISSGVAQFCITLYIGHSAKKAVKFGEAVEKQIVADIDEENI